MNLPNPVPTVDPGPDYSYNIQASINGIDQHNHSPGQGIAIQPNGLNISSDLSFVNNNAIQLRSVRFTSQLAVLSLPADVACLYVVGNELYYNDYTGGNNVQITMNGVVNATSSGISSGTATAAFVAGTLVVKSSSSSFANVDVQSIILSNAGNITNQLTLQAPTLTSSIIETLPAIPVSTTSIMQMDTSGNMSAALTVDNSTLDITSNQIEVKALGIAAAQIANSTITGSKIASSTITGSNVASNINLPGNQVQENGKNVVVSNTNAAGSLSVIRGIVAAAGNPAGGEGFGSSQIGSGVYDITWTTAFADIPSITVTVFPSTNAIKFSVITAQSASGCTIIIWNFAGSPEQNDFDFIAIGARV